MVTRPQPEVLDDRVGDGHFLSFKISASFHSDDTL